MAAMNLINVENITKSYTDSLLFDEASFTVDEQEKVGIIGINGTGKTTLLRMIVGMETPEKGTITRANHIVIRYLPQHPSFRENSTVLEAVMEGNLRHDNEWSLESEAKTMLQKLGITDYDQIVDSMSGGQRKRIALANTLLAKADVLVLDEPTNHLDSSMADWLEEYLKNFRGAVIMVTHDRYFLDSVSNRIVEIDKGKTYSYQTNYSGFLQLKAQREEMQAATERKRQSILRVEIEWMQRGARARSTKQKAHIQRYEELAAQKGPAQEEALDIIYIFKFTGHQQRAQITAIFMVIQTSLLIQTTFQIFRASHLRKISIQQLTTLNRRTLTKTILKQSLAQLKVTALFPSLNLMKLLMALLTKY